MDSLTRYLPAHMRLEDGLNLSAIVAGIDEAFDSIAQFFVDAQRQLYFSTAEGQYLIQLAAAKGFYLERGSGINIEGFKKIAPAVALAPKQAYGTLLQLLEAFYAVDYVRPNIIADESGPYTLLPGDTLTIRQGSETVTVVFPSSAFADFRSITATELASYLNSLNKGFQALSFFNRSTGESSLQIISGRYGASATLQVLGGTAQPILRLAYYHEPTHTVGTRLNITKPASHSDQVTFTWDGVVPDPGLYRLAVGDYVTFRNLLDVGTTGVASVADTDEWGYPDGTVTSRSLVAGNYSILNGTHQIIEIGENSFKIAVPGFFPENNSGRVWLRSVRDMILQKNQARRLYDQSEYAVLSETTPNTVTVTVPAVPPVVRRYLEGAWHLHGSTANISAVTRNSVTMTAIDNDFPDQCLFAVQSKRIAPSFDRQWYRTAARAGNTWILDSSSPLFPYTSAQLINLSSTTPLNCALDSNLVTVNADQPHYLLPGYAVTFSDVALNDGFNINGTFPVESILSSTSFTVRTINKLTGSVPAQRVSVVRLPVRRSDGANAYLQFASAAALILSGISDGTRVRATVDGTTTVYDGTAMFALQQGYMGVTDLDGARAYVTAPINLGTGSIGDDVLIRRAIESWGGAIAKYHFDQTNVSNIPFFEDFKAILADYTQPANSLFVGSYLYNLDSPYTLSRYGALTTSIVYSGSADVIAVLDSSAAYIPSSGYCVFAYGTEREEGPIRYTAVYKSGGRYQMRLDPTYVFEHTHPIGDRVWICSALLPPVPDTYGKMYQPYLTGTATARNKLFDIMEVIVAAGVFIESEILFPALKYEDASAPVFQ